jgi:hypothetical protein
MSTETFERVAHDFSVSITEAHENFPGDLVLEQWMVADHEPPDAAALNRIYIAPGQTPRVVKAMLDALRRTAPPQVHATAVQWLQEALDERKADGRAGWLLTPDAVHRMAEMLRRRRGASADADNAEAQAPKPQQQRRSKKARR